jgi:hypothetical protein
LPDEVQIGDLLNDSFYENFTGFVPTTYEAARAYLDEQIKKPAGQRHLHREQCVMVVAHLPENQNVAFFHKTTNTLMKLRTGVMIVTHVN